jgi:hypothetical protein
MSSSKTSDLTTTWIGGILAILIFGSLAVMNNVNYFTDNYASIWFTIDKVLFTLAAIGSGVDIFRRKDAGPITNVCMLIVFGVLAGSSTFFSDIPEFERRVAATYSFICSVLAIATIFAVTSILRKRPETPAS